MPLSAGKSPRFDVTPSPLPSWMSRAQDWQERLLDSPNHRENWGLVQLISLSNDEQLHTWLVGAAQ
jgi:hypothetical protein